MGIKLFSDTPSCDYGTVDGQSHLHIKAPNRDGNPNKYRFNILKTKQIGNAIVVLIHYPDCFSWSGNKICVYDDAQKFMKLQKEQCIDPHFLEHEYSPLARFEPSKRGWDLAVKFVAVHNKEIAEGK